MASRLIGNRADIRAVLGEKFDNELTFPKILRDGEDAIRPVMIERDGKLQVVINSADVGAFHVAKTKLAYIAYGRYFDWNQPADLRGLSFAEAVARVVGTDDLAVDDMLPLSRYLALSRELKLRVEDSAPEGRRWIYRKKRREIELQWVQSRDADAVATRGFVESLRFGKQLNEALRATAPGFEVLDRLCADSMLDAIYVSAPFNLEMFTGLPEAVIRQLDLSVIFIPQSPDIIVLAAREFDRSDYVPAGQDDFAAAIKAVLPLGRIGVEEDYIGIGRYRQIEICGFALEKATVLLRRWQELRAGADLTYFIVAANGVLQGIAHAREYMRVALAHGTTETAIGAVYHQGVEAFADSIGMGGRLRPYFDIIHPGERTLLPAIASDTPVNAGHKTIKFDMGLFALDSYGCIRGCSDIARSFSPQAELQAVHDMLRKLLIDELIPSIRAEMQGEEVHRIGIKVLEPHTEQIRAAGMLGPNMTMHGYVRDCGHSLQRQTVGTVHFMPGDKNILKQGMLGCTEFVWPYQDKLLATEDAYYVMASGAIPFTI